MRFLFVFLLMGLLISCNVEPVVETTVIQEDQPVMIVAYGKVTSEQFRTGDYIEFRGPLPNVQSWDENCSGVPALVVQYGPGNSPDLVKFTTSTEYWDGDDWIGTVCYGATTQYTAVGGPYEYTLDHTNTCVGGANSQNFQALDCNTGLTDVAINIHCSASYDDGDTWEEWYTIWYQS